MAQNDSKSDAGLVLQFGETEVRFAAKDKMRKVIDPDAGTVTIYLRDNTQHVVHVPGFDPAADYRFRRVAVMGLSHLVGDAAGKHAAPADIAIAIQRKSAAIEAGDFSLRTEGTGIQGFADLVAATATVNGVALDAMHPERNMTWEAHIKEKLLAASEKELADHRKSPKVAAALAALVAARKQASADQVKADADTGISL